jgi:hypothetical protein
MANNKKPLPLDSGVQKDLSWPAMCAIKFTKFRQEIFPDFFLLPDMYPGSLTMRRHSISTKVLH